MQTIEQAVPLLKEGDFLSREEFLRRWEAMPNLKRAELIRGVVYMPSPLSLEHGSQDIELGTWLGVYKAYTPGCEGLSNATWFMGEDETPQPDKALRILPEYGGQSRNEGRFGAGAPEFLGETCLTSTAYDLHEKLEIYQEEGVLEYLAVLIQENEVRWHQLVNGRFEVVPQPADGVHRSVVFPGLWLDAKALLARDLAKVFAVLNEGIASLEHAQFVERLAQMRKNKESTDQ